MTVPIVESPYIPYIEIQLQTEDQVIFCSDGIIEAENTDGESMIANLLKTEKSLVSSRTRSRKSAVTLFGVPFLRPPHLGWPLAAGMIQPSSVPQFVVAF